MHTMNIKSRLLIATIAASFAAAAGAADQADVRVTAAVINNCKIKSSEDINFGKLDPALATDQKAQGSVTFACTKNVDYTVAADQGANFDSAASKRRMKGADQNFLPYALEQASFTGKGQGFSAPIRVALAANIAGTDYKDLPADNYADLLRVTITP
jgi:spore coat protein U-like protein